MAGSQRRGNVRSEKDPRHCSVDVLLGSVTHEARPDAGAGERSDLGAHLGGKA
jgi:hypothetical protein